MKDCCLNIQSIDIYMSMCVSEKIKEYFLKDINSSKKSNSSPLKNEKNVLFLKCKNKI